MRKWGFTIVFFCIIISITSCNTKVPAEIESVSSSSAEEGSLETHTGTILDQQSDPKPTDVTLMTESEPVTQLVINGKRLSSFEWVDNETLSFIEIEKLPDDSERAELAVYNLDGDKLSSIAIGSSPYDHKASGAEIHDTEEYVYYYMSFGPVIYARIDRNTHQIEDCTAKLPASGAVPHDGFYRARYIDGFFAASDETGLFLAPIDDLDAKHYIRKHDIANETYYELYTQTESPYPNKSKAFIYKHEGYSAKFPDRSSRYEGDTTLQLLDYTTGATLDIAKGQDPTWARLNIKLSLLKCTDQYFVTYRSDYTYDEFVKDFKGNEVYSTKKGHTLSIVGSTLYEYQKIDDYYVVSSLNLATMERTNLLYLKAPGALLVSPTGDKLAYYYNPHYPNYPNQMDYVNIYSMRK